MNLTNSIFKLLIGASVFVFALSTLFYSVNSANAEPTGQSRNTTSFMAPEGMHGKYALQYVAGVDNSGAFYWQMVISNTETGAYKAFRWDRDAQDWKELFGDSKPFPKLP